MTSPIYNSLNHCKFGLLEQCRFHPHYKTAKKNTCNK